MRLRWMMACGWLMAGQAANAAPPPAGPSPAARTAAPAAPVAAATPRPATPAAVLPPPPPGPVGSTLPEGRAIDAATFVPGLTAITGRDLMVRAQVILDRARLSPGAIDGRDGSNFRRALAAFDAAHKVAVPAAGLPELDAAAWTALSQTDAGPVTQDHVITAEEIKGPFLGRVPEGMAAQALLPHMGFASPIEALAEAFHMDESLLRALNPAADFAVAGTRVLVVRPAAAPLPPVARIEVDKSHDEVRAYDEAGQMVAAFPATVGSHDRPAPSGQYAVRFVVNDPTYTYDPRRLTFGKRKNGKLTIRPGPNNPVGSTWIDLTIETFGIHGTPDPSAIGKTASHGCVRLTNWDAAALGQAVRKGTAVVFVGAQSRKG